MTTDFAPRGLTRKIIVGVFTGNALFALTAAFAVAMFR
ncbi:hypothetical protein UFOVP131_17 [uncultured Caudovirales phage]|jgi:hypothetical protein|uniref:Uncharacterized protein n=1 Tax=uncultured Caudovirales phage TaxID=2100421 RepID=A0A6J5LEX8_9CAUD|nr:hypothetical protein UFOVP131_17 [uncultured Caudovirales phage]